MFELQDILWSVALVVVNLAAILALICTGEER